MSVYVEGLEMPKEGNWKTIRIYPDGTCVVPNWQGDCTVIKGADATSVPSHGRLIDADSKTFPTSHRNPSNDYMKGWNACLRSIQQQPTIIPAEKDKI